MGKCSKIFGIVGYPLEKSKSKEIHKIIMKELGIDGEYEILPQQEINISSLKRLDGFSVTMPYKEEIVDHLKWLNISAAVFNVVNTVKNTKDGLTGFNTDIFGFNKALEGKDIDYSDILIIGCGGLAKSLCYELLSKEGNITILYREGSKHIEEFKGLFNEITDKVKYITKAEKAYSLVINAAPYIEGTDYNIDEEVIKHSKYVFDANYKQESSLLTIARKSGVDNQNGLDMLIYQAIKQEEIWNSLTLDETGINKIFNKVKEEL